MRFITTRKYYLWANWHWPIDIELSDVGRLLFWLKVMPSISPELYADPDLNNA
jgi:hypothetical protein